MEGTAVISKKTLAWAHLLYQIIKQKKFWILFCRMIILEKQE